ncbi:MAG: alkaline phosphatase family protein [Planctomycetaceae bacterium]|nr:MAG: alkaline phosphatase family protein [Planctomycetaceae bacterium]
MRSLTTSPVDRLPMHRVQPMSVLRPTRVAVLCLAAVGLIASCLLPGAFAESPDSPPVASDKPRLIVVVSIDQLCQDYLIRFQDNFPTDPEESFFARVLQQGAWFPNCHHAHAFTYTAPGHSVQLTGAHPAGTGVIANDWFDRETGRSRYCVSDPTVGIVGLPDGKPMSPRVMLVDTVGDQLKLATGGQAKVFGVAIKDRAAILMSGHRADGAYWLEKNQWVTSTYYRDNLPGYLRVLNDGNAIDRYRGLTWELLLPRERYHNQGDDDNEFENPPKGFTAAFPHRLAAAGEGDTNAFGDQVLFSPFGNDYTLMAARQIIESEQLGADDIPDLLAINFSSNDYVGHAFGPLSFEVEDMTYRTDRQLAEFVRYLDTQVGADRWTVVITSDHGVAPIPEMIAQRGGPAAIGPGEAVTGPKRNPLGSLTEVRGKLTELLRQDPHLGRLMETLTRDDTAAEIAELPLILAMDHSQVFLNHAHPALQGPAKLIAQRAVRDWLIAQPYVAIAATREDLLGGGGTGVMEQLQRSFHPGRSGDVLFAYTPYSIPGSSSATAKPTGTTHGSPWHYDTNVPLLWVGRGINPGRYDRRVTPAQIAPTVARMLGVNDPGGCVSEPLHEVFTPPARF